MARLYSFKFFSNLFLVILVVSFFIIPEPAFAWAAIKSDSWATSDLTTHQSMLQIAYDRLFDDVGVKDQKDAFPDLNTIKSWEGVSVASSTSGYWWGAFTKGGPDAGEVSSDSEHYYNPANKTGRAPNSVQTHYALLLDQMYPNTGGPASEKGAKNASWAAHYLADIHVPYHTVGMPAERAIVGNQTVLSTDDFGSYLLYNPGKIRFDAECQAAPQSIEEPEIGWGKGGDFRWEIESFRKYNSANYSQHADYRDWFDPWYYNGFTMLSWSVQIGTGSHAQWEKSTHNYLLTYNNLLARPSAYSPDWKNATPTFDLPFSTHLANQARQAQLFTIAAAAETRAKLSQYLCTRSVPANKSIERMATLWRASLTALRPSLKVNPDASNPKLLKVIATIGSAEPNDPAQNVQAKLTVTGGTVRGNAIQGIKDPISPNSPRPLNWDVDSPNPDACKFKLEVICNYQKTPDLQYSVVEPSGNGLAVTVSPGQAQPGDTVKLNVKLTPPAATSLTISSWGPLVQRAGPFTTREADGTFTGDFQVDKSAKSGLIVVEARALNLTGNANLIRGPVPVATPVREATVCLLSYQYHGYYREASRSRDYDPILNIPMLRGSFTGDTFNGSGSTKVGNVTFTHTAQITVDPTAGNVTRFTATLSFSGAEDTKITITGTNIPIQPPPPSSTSPVYNWYCNYYVRGKDTCSHITSLTDAATSPWLSQLTKWDCNSDSVINIMFGKPR